MLEVGHRQLAQGSIDGFAVAESGVIGFRDGAPMPALAEDGQDVVVVAHGFEIEQQGRVADQAQRGGGEQGAFHALGGAVAKHAARRSAGGAEGLLVVSQAVEEALDFFGGGETAEDGALSRGEGVGHRVQVSTVERASWPAMPAFPQDPDLTGTTSLPYTSPYADSAPCLVVRRRPQPV